MSNKSMALAALAALALSAQAQVYNWTLSTTDPNSPGEGSGQFTLTGDVVTAMSGTVGGNSVSLIAPGGYKGNDNKLPADFGTLSFSVSGYGNVSLYTYMAFISWESDQGVGVVSTFSYTPVPEPSTWAMGGVFGLAAVVTVAARRRQRATQA